MYNGQEEEQQLPQVGTAQKPSLYQFLGSMSPEEHMKFKGFMHKRKGQQQITSNVGGERAAELMSEVETGTLSITDAVSRSKEELTPSMKLIDQQYYKPDITSESMMILKERKGRNWTTTEYNLWAKRHADIISRENQQMVAEGKMLKVDADNAKIADKALVKYRQLNSAIDTAMKGHFVTDKYGNILPNKEGRPVITAATNDEGEFMYETEEKKVKKPSMTQEDQNMLNEKWDYIKSEIAKDVNPATYGQGNQEEMTKALWVVANIVPTSFLRTKKGIMVGDEFINLYGLTYDSPTVRRLYFDKLNSLLIKGKGIVAGVNSGGSVTEEDNTSMSSSEIQTITTQQGYDALPSGTVFIDPNGDKRTKP